MLHHLLLISDDVQLAERVRRALPAHLPLELHLESRYAPACDPRGWLLLLIDGRQGAAAAALPTSEPAPLLWFHSPSRAAPSPGRVPPFPATRVLDVVAGDTSGSKLCFILHQHLAAAYLRRLRQAPAPTDATVAELQARLKNALTGILGNAELAAEAGRAGGKRMLPALAGRLQRIAELAAQMRELWAQFEDATALSGAALATLAPPPPAAPEAAA